MSIADSFSDLTNVSRHLVDLVRRAAPAAVAVKAAPYRVVSGVAFAPDLIAVADHALRRQDRVAVQTYEGVQATATLLGRDPSVDIAILKAEQLPAARLDPAEPDTLRAGSLAAVVGLTIDVGPSASLGMLGAVGGPRRTWRGGTLDHFFRLDVNLYPSQSGAAVVDSECRLIGLATPGLLRHSAVAVPVATLTRVATELMNTGRIRRGYLGIGLQPVAIPERLRLKLGLDSESGLMVLSVETDSPAQQADLQLGDILISLDGKTLADIDDLQAMLRGDIVGRSVPVVLIRGGERVDATVAVAQRASREN